MTPLWPLLVFALGPWLGLSHPAALVKREIPEDHYFVDVPTSIETILQEISQHVDSSSADEKSEALKTILDDDKIQGELQNPNLSYGQLHHILDHLINLLPKDVTLSMVIPSNLLVGLPSLKLINIRAYGPDGQTVSPETLSILKNLRRMMPSQKLATFASFIRSSDEFDIDPTQVGQLIESLPQNAAELGQLLKYIGVDDFRKYFRKFENSVDILKGNDDNGYDVKVILSHFLTKPQLRVWLDEMDFKSSVKSLEPFINTLSCHDVKGIRSFGEVLQTLWAFNEVRPLLPITPFPLDLKKCFKERIETELRDRSGQELTEDESILDFLEEDEIKLIGAPVLASFPYEYFENMKKTEISKALLKQLGTFAMIDLLTSLPLKKTRKFADMAVQKFDLESGFLTYEDLDNLGIFSSFSTDDVLNRASSTALAEFMHKNMAKEYHKIGCFPDYGMTRWRSAVKKIFGSPTNWGIANVTTLGSMLITLEDEEWTDMKRYVRFRYASYFLEKNEYYSNYEKSPIHTNHTTVATVCEKWLGEDETETFTRHLNKLFSQFLKMAQLRANLITEWNESNSPDRVKRQTQELSLADIRRLIYVDINEKLGKGMMPLSFYSEAKQIDEDVQTYTKIKLESYLGGKIEKKDDEKWAEVVNRLIQDGVIIGDQNVGTVEIINEMAVYHMKAVAKAAKITHVDLGISEDVFCSFLNEICELQEYKFLILKPRNPVALLEEDSVNSARLPDDIDCEGLKEFKSAGESINPTETFKHWTKEEFEKCLETLGSINWNLETKLDLWDLMTHKDVHVTNMGKIPPKYAIILNNLLEAVAIRDMSRLNLTILYDTESISLLGQFSFDQERLTKLVKQLVADSGRHFPDAYLDKPDMDISDVLLFGSMKHLVCGFEHDEVERVLKDDSVAKVLLPIFGSMKSCPNKAVLKHMADKAQSLYGEVEDWEAPVIMSLGIVLAGLGPKEFAQIGDCCFGSISRATLAHLDFDHLKELDPEKVAMLPPEALASLVSLHLKKDDAILSEESRMALNNTINEIKEHHDMAPVADALMDIEMLLESLEEKVEESKPKSSSGKILQSDILTTVILCFIILMKLF